VNYPNLENVDSIFKDYITDALKERERIERSLLNLINNIFIENERCITQQLLSEQLSKARNSSQTKAVIKSLSPSMIKFIDEEAKKLERSLFFTIQSAIFSCLFASLSPMARLKLDYLIFQEMKEKEKGKGKERIGEGIELDRSSGSLYIQGFGSLPIYTGVYTGEAEAKGKKDDYVVLMKTVQHDIAEQARSIAKSSMQKKQIFDGKEFSLSKRLWDISEENAKTLKELIKSNINKDVARCVDAIDRYYTKGKRTACAEYPDMMRRINYSIPPNASFESYRLARNEMAEITFRASLQDYIENPFVSAVQWLLANNRLKKYENACSCNDLAFQDAYGLGRGIYPIDKVPDRPHVMCLCTVAPVSSRQIKKVLAKGMEIGNVPTKEWLESGKEERNASIIKDKENQYGITLFHNENPKALQQACIHAIKSHDWFNNGVKDVDKDAFVEDLKQSSSLGLFILARYSSDMEVDLYCKDWEKKNSRYSPSENKVYCNLYKDAERLDNKALDFKLGMKSFLHEAGHWADNNITDKKFGLAKKMNRLYDSIKADVLNAINKTGRELYGSAFKPLMQSLDRKSLIDLNPRIKNAVTEKIRENLHINSNISDMYGAVTFNLITGCKDNMYGHPNEYWRYKDVTHPYLVKMEFIANALESLGNLKRVEAMKTFLPHSWNDFVSGLKDVILG